MAGDVKRPYNMSRRQALTSQTRRQIVNAAKPLFIEHGYHATSMRLLAEAAGVSLQTLYNVFSSKFGVFSALVDSVVAGDQEPVAMADRPQVRALAAVDDPVVLVRGAVAVATEVLVRLDEIYPTLRGAAVSDPDVAAAYQRFALEARYDVCRDLAAQLIGMGAARGAIDATKAADIFWTILSPDTYHLLTAHRGWSPAEYSTWAADTLIATLVNPVGVRQS